MRLSEIKRAQKMLQESSGSFESQIEDKRTGNIIDVIVTFEYSPYSRGRSEYRGGPQIEPDEQENVEIVSVKDASTGKEVSTSPEDDERLASEAMEYAGDDADDWEWEKAQHDAAFEDYY